MIEINALLVFIISPAALFRGPVVTPAGSPGFHLIATLQFDDLAVIQRAFASAEGQAAAADVQTFATGGADMPLFDSREV